jgi:hypothetical protein
MEIYNGEIIFKMKLTQEQIIEIKELSKEKSANSIAKMFNVSVSTIQWHTNLKHRNYVNTYWKKRKIWDNDKRRLYQKEYHRNRYHNDEEFRKRQIELVRTSQIKALELKGGVI